jgi:phasin family protein
MAKKNSKSKASAAKTKKNTAEKTVNVDFEHVAAAATDNAKAIGSVIAESARMAGKIGVRNVQMMTRTAERGYETTQAMTSAGDLRTAFELQTNFAKSVVSAYTSEMKEQAKLYKSFWQDTVKPLGAQVR